MTGALSTEQLATVSTVVSALSKGEPRLTIRGIASLGRIGVKLTGSGGF